VVVRCVLVALAAGACSSGDDVVGAESATSTSTAVSACETSVTAFFEPAISDAALADAAETVAAMEGVVGVDVLDQAEGYAQARRVFADDPATLERIEEADVPPSIWIETKDRQTSDQVAEAVASLPFIRGQAARGGMADFVQEAIGDEAARRWCEG
jgi:cell division protein FtsX